ncbi:MAG: multicomponent Na+:H+ antiporter subunit C [Paraglaciecola sp.]|jgi:multicomponent Na+:H+ antiporter subunit C
MMSQVELYTFCAVILLGMGMTGLILNQHIIRKIIALNIMGIGIFMLLISTAGVHSGAIDPVPHAMVLTGIVVAVAGSALALNLAARLKDMTEQADD